MSAAIKEQAKFVVERTYRATVEEIWELWTTKDGFESWWGPEGFRGDVHAIDARAGGALRYDMVADTRDMVAAMEKMGGGASHAVNARFTVYEPFTRLAITSAIDFIPGVTPYDNTILVELEPRGDSVRMVVTIDAHPDPKMSAMSAEGFTSQLGKLDRRFT